ncbi:MAG: TIM barrel protein [Lachnospiraceae bacterium]|nr:TIM barrel protein [Lachnospiraceae bacterium]
MNGSIHQYFSIGTLLWMSYPGRDPLASLKKIVCDEFFDAVELSRFEDPAVRKQAAAMMEQGLMRVGYGAHPTILGRKLNPNALEETARLAAETALLEAVDEAAELGAEGIAFLAGKWEPEHLEEAYAQLLKTTRNLCGYAAEKGLSVELEVFDYDVDKAVLIGPAPLAARFAADVRKTHRNFGLLVDLSHIPICHETPDFTVRTLAPYITHLHIGNAVMKEGCPAYGDRHPRFGFPNSENSVETLTAFLRLLKDEGFFREDDPLILSFEVTPFGDEDPDAVLAGCKRALNRAWALV